MVLNISPKRLLLHFALFVLIINPLESAKILSVQETEKVTTKLPENVPSTTEASTTAEDMSGDTTEFFPDTTTETPEDNNPILLVAGTEMESEIELEFSGVQPSLDDGDKTTHEISTEPHKIKLSSEKLSEDAGASENSIPSSLTKSSSKDDCPNVCLTKGCTKAAASAIQWMNLTADPCEDFFEFSCGGFVRETFIPEEKTTVNSFSLLSDQLRNKLRAVIEEEPNQKDSNVTTMVKNLYKSCMNTTIVKKLGSTPLLKIFDKFGGWPVLKADKWNESTFDWIKSVYTNRKLGYSIDYFIDFSVGTDVKNSTKRIIWIDQTPLGLAREYLIKGFKDKDVKSYYNYSVEIATHLGADRKLAEKEMKEVLLFQIELANISLPREKMRNITKLYNLYTLANLTKLIPEIPWVNYTNTLLAPQANVTENETLSVSSFDFVLNFTKLMKKTPKRVQANYLLWRIASASIFLLPEEARNIQLEYWKKVSGVKKRNPRWKECLSVVSSRLPLPVSHIYISHYFDEAAKGKAEELVRYVKQEFLKVLNSTTWMDNKTKEQAFKKAQAMKHWIGYPEELKNATLIYEIYQSLKINNGTFFENILSQNIYLTDVIFSRLREAIDKNDWQKRAAVATINAFYRFNDNSILIPAGILEGVFYDPGRPNYMNFGAIGFIIGHEITHGFDDRGKQFDSLGDLKNWWQPETQKKYRDKANCFVYQYGNYTAPENGVKLNGINTQGENIADNGGIKQSYAAYQMWLANNTQEQRMPGLQEFNQNQTFWIAAAQIWCSKSRPEALKISLRTGVHSPGRFRVNGPFSNAEEFSRDWKCPVGAKMNPKSKCNVW